MVQGYSSICVRFPYLRSLPHCPYVIFTLCSCPCVCLCVCNCCTCSTPSMKFAVFASMLARLPYHLFLRLHLFAWPHGKSTALRPRLTGWSAQK